ncbi:hypothetical protein Lgee_0407 [Legionella geestiana]|uniref:Uncharacterized protein n=1 Tax=Legionella geestiana TaxID=45065 RepID=A0A0W0U817_9GAMM|nr:hypothetical protein [Legionella geestiana]KTD03957.1 hypothetical protein Lgee_0407 [Legionella geestiana]QBS12962.1 hypothetical protein E4T54_09550 [Legionella geestiana]QDQ39356.1 hypothetical protein E3226_002510 [Legionella geestiana]STX54532.1 Uncharacterised protein [Legionella geestiana]
MKILKSMMFTALAVCSSFSQANSTTPLYNLSTLVDMSTNSEFARANCPVSNGNHTCNVAGSTRDILGNIYVTMVVPKGQIFKITPAGKTSLYATLDIGSDDPAAIDNNNVAFRVTMDALANMYVSFRSVDTTQNPTDMNGVWVVPAGGGHCALDSSNTCKKLFPAIGQTTNPVLRFVDGVTLDGFGNLYLADAQMGNVWKINLFSKNGALWAGTDAGSSPNFLAGNPIDILLGSPLSGRGFGVVGLDYDKLKNVLYATNFDTGSVIAVPVKLNGSAGKQSVSLNLSAEDRQLEAIQIVDDLFNVHGRKLVVANTLSGFIGFSKFVGCQQNIPGFCPAPFVQPSNGQQLLSANLDAPGGLNFQPLINNPELQAPASVINGVLRSQTLYINALGQLDGSGSKILKATPVR